MLSNYEPLDLTNQNITFPDINSQIINNTIYIWDPQNPTVWDLRISFSTVKTGTISVIGKQINNELTSYISSNEEPISLLEFGNISANDMFSIAKSENKSAFVDNAYELKFTWSNDTGLQIETVESVVQYLRANPNGTNDPIFRFYKNTSTGSNVTFYKLDA